MLFIFIMECVIKVVVFGPSPYWRDGFNRVDAVVTVLCTLSVAVQYSIAAAAQGHEDESSWSLSVTMGFLVGVSIRSIRFIRILRFLKPFWRVLATLRSIIPLLARIGAVLGIMLYISAIIGMEAFAGRLSMDDPNVQGSAYGHSAQQSMTFDTFMHSIVVQFALLMVTRSPIMMEGILAAEQSWWPLIFFGVFYVVMVIVATNVLVALILQGYSSRFSREVKRGDGLCEAWEHLCCVA